MTKNKTDILFVTHRHEIAGGAEKALLEMLDYLCKRKIICHVISGAEGSFTQELKKLKIDYSIIGQPFWAHGPEDNSPFVYSGPNPRINPVAQSVDLIRQLRPTLCVTNTIVVPWLAYASAITNTHHAWMVHENGTDGLKLQYGIGEKQTMKTVDILSDAIFFNSEWTKSSYNKHIETCKNISIIYPGGTPPSVPRNQKKNPYNEKNFNISIIGQIKPQKGQLDVVKALKLLSEKSQNVRLNVIGGVEDTKYYEKILNYVDKYNLSKFINITGQVDNPYNYLINSDIITVCAQNEAFGRVTVEAMMLKKPVIGAASAGTLELIQDNLTGFLYNPGDIDRLYAILNKAMSDKSDFKRIAIKGYDFAIDKFNEKTRFAAFVDYFNNIEKDIYSLTLSPLFPLVENYELIINELNIRDSKKLSIYNVPNKIIRKCYKLAKNILLNRKSI